MMGPWSNMIFPAAKLKEATLPNHSKERDQAEARFKRAQKATQDANEARARYESEARAVRDKDCKTESTPVGQRGGRLGDTS